MHLKHCSFLICLNLASNSDCNIDITFNIYLLGQVRSWMPGISPRFDFLNFFWCLVVWCHHVGDLLTGSHALLECIWISAGLVIIIIFIVIIISYHIIETVAIVNRSTTMKMISFNLFSAASFCHEVRKDSGTTRDVSEGLLLGHNGLL